MLLHRPWFLASERARATSITAEGAVLCLLSRGEEACTLLTTHDKQYPMKHIGFGPQKAGHNFGTDLTMVLAFSTILKPPTCVSSILPSESTFMADLGTNWTQSWIPSQSPKPTFFAHTSGQGHEEMLFGLDPFSHRCLQKTPFCYINISLKHCQSCRGGPALPQ